jgi:hypothetical protein
LDFVLGRRPVDDRRRRTQIAARADQCGLHCTKHNWFQGRYRTLTVGLTERDETHAGGHQIRCQCV